MALACHELRHLAARRLRQVREARSGIDAHFIETGRRIGDQVERRVAENARHRFNVGS